MPYNTSGNRAAASGIDLQIRRGQRLRVERFVMPRWSKVMNWDFDGDGGWDAFSSVGDDGRMFQWRITVCDDGTFAVNESDAELTDRKETFDTLRDAKSWCAERDEEFRLACLREDASA